MTSGAYIEAHWDSIMNAYDHYYWSLTHKQLWERAGDEIWNKFRKITKIMVKFEMLEGEEEEDE